MDDVTMHDEGNNSAEMVAFKLLKIIATLEDQNIPGLSQGQNTPDRKYVLNRYAECLRAVKNPFTYGKPA